MTDYFNPSSRSKSIHRQMKEQQITVNCDCGSIMTYDPDFDVLKCEKCGIDCTPEYVIAVIRGKKRFK